MAGGGAAISRKISKSFGSRLGDRWCHPIIRFTKTSRGRSHSSAVRSGLSPRRRRTRAKRMNNPATIRCSLTEGWRGTAPRGWCADHHDARDCERFTIRICSRSSRCGRSRSSRCSRSFSSLSRCSRSFASRSARRRPSLHGSCPGSHAGCFTGRTRYRIRATVIFSIQSPPVMPPHGHITVGANLSRLATYSCRHAAPLRVRSPRAFNSDAMARRDDSPRRRLRIVASTSCSS